MPQAIMYQYRGKETVILSFIEQTCRMQSELVKNPGIYQRICAHQGDDSHEC